MQPNFHWGFMQSGYGSVKSPLAVDPYCAYGVDRIAATRELARAEWDAFLAELESAGVVQASDNEAFDREFTASQRKKAQPRPGLFCEFNWTLTEAARLDDRGRLVGAVRDRLNQMLRALRAPELMAHE